MTTHEFAALPIRPSDADRDRAIEVLKEGVVLGRLSHETFIRRMDLVLHARGLGELRSLTADLPTVAVATWMTRAVGVTSALARRTRRGWLAAGLPKLMLPAPGLYPVRIGRDEACDLRIADECVSRLHAELRTDGVRWLLRDLGSMNGTWVNKVRVVGEVPVEAGDAVRFGQSAFRLAVR